MDTTVATTLSFSPYSISNTLQQGKEINEALALTSQTDVEATKQSTVSNSYTLNAQTSVNTIKKVELVERSISLSNESIVERKGFNYNIYENVFRKFQWTSELDAILADVSFGSLKASTSLSDDPKATTSLTHKKASTSGSFKKATTEGISLYTYKRQVVSNTISLNNETRINDGERLKILSKELSLLGATSLQTIAQNKDVQKNLTLNPLTFSFSSEQGFKLNRGLSLNNTSIISKTTSTTVSRDLYLIRTTEVYNAQSVKSLDAALSLIRFSDLKTRTATTAVNNSVSLIPNTELTTITSTTNLSKTLSLIPVNNNISTKFNDVSATLSLVNANIIQGIEFTTISNTLNLTPSSEVLNAQSIKQLNESLSLDSLSEVITLFDTKDVQNFIILSEANEVQSITDLIQIGNTLSTTESSVLETSSTPTTVSNSLSLVSSSSLITTTETADIANTLSLVSSNEQWTFVTPIQINNLLSLISSTAIDSVDKIVSSTSINLTPSTLQNVHATEILEPQSSLNNNGWQSASQGIMIEDIGGITPDDSTGIIHSSVSSSDRSISFDYGLNNLSFISSRDNHTLKVRYSANSGLGSINLRVEIISGSTVRRTETYNNVGQTIIQRDIVLTQVQADTINYNDIQMRLTAFTTDGSNKEITVTWGVFEIPEVIQ